MPELPDITVYVEALNARIYGQRLDSIRITAPFLLRTAVPPITAAEGKTVHRVWRIGKRIAIGLEEDLTLVLHLMIAGRLHWKEAGAKLAGKNALAAFDFPDGSLTLTEAGSKRRASLHLLQGTEALEAINPGGLEVMDSSPEEFRAALQSENHTLKRSLTDPRLFSGIGNAYSDEILFEARLSPAMLSQRMDGEEVERLHRAVVEIMQLWTNRLREEAGGKFPEKVTAFHKEMAVHGRYNLPCIRCGTPIQRIKYADNETNYCPTCQTDGKLLSDRGLSRLLGKDWPKSIEALETMTARHRG